MVSQREIQQATNDLDDFVGLMAKVIGEKRNQDKHSGFCVIAKNKKTGKLMMHAGMILGEDMKQITTSHTNIEECEMQAYAWANQMVIAYGGKRV